MQAQATKLQQHQDVLTSQQSLQCVQTLLRAGLGCITYLRNLLPTDNFSESYLMSGGSDSRCPSSVNSSFVSESGKANVSGFKVMTVTRGYTEEADKLLDYLELGIFDALEKQYLKSFIFAIYLDNDDPNNIVEAYTFNFQYFTVPGTNISVPVMSLGEDLMKLSISGKKKTPDPVLAAVKLGKAPTLGDVKRSLKALVKNLIQATTQMDALPKRRFATFKLFYYDHTPDNYEPPHFRPGDVTKDKWFFATHNRQEVPEKCSVGTLQTGWHGVDLRISSIAGFLPSVEDNEAPFCGTTTGCFAVSPLTPAEEAATRLHQLEQQKVDAVDRKVVWDAESGLGDIDADGEDENEEGSQVLGTWRVRPTGSLELMAPIGMRDEDGNIVPLPAKDSIAGNDCLSLVEAQFRGAKEKVPAHICELDNPLASTECTQTQKIEGSRNAAKHLPLGSPLSSPPASASPSPPLTPTPQPMPPRMATRSKARTVISQPTQSTLPPSDPIQSSEESSQDMEIDQLQSQSIDTQVLKDILVKRQGNIFLEEDLEMLDTNTQLPESIGGDCSAQICPSGAAVDSSQAEVNLHASRISIDCECGVNVDDSDCILCEGGCAKWFHTWCMGYQGSEDKNLPEQFVCFDCRVRADQNWDLIVVHNLHPRMMDKFRSLALFRRAIKLYETQNPENLAAFIALIGCESIVAGQLFKRLEHEGFIALETIEQDELGVMETRSTKSNSKKGSKAKPRRKNTRKQRYVFVRGVVNTQAYLDYFSPTPEVEKRVLGLADLGPKRKSDRNRKEHKRNMEIAMSQIEHTDIPGIQAEETRDDASAQKLPPSQDESQTQAETQFRLETQLEEDVDTCLDLKRKTTMLSDEACRKTKKVKVSIGLAVDLGD